MATAPAPPPLPVLRLVNSMTPDQVSSELNKWAAQLVNFLRDGTTATSSPAGSYSTSNGTGSRTLNVSTATATQVGDVLASLISDIKKKGIIK